jgi:hypothetical protein
MNTIFSPSDIASHPHAEQLAKRMKSLTLSPDITLPSQDAHIQPVEA